MRWGWPAAAPRWWSTISAARATAPAARCPRPKPWSRKSAKPAAPRWPTAPTSRISSRSPPWSQRATKEWGSVDLLCANAGILRDKSFGKMEAADFAEGARRASHRHLLLLQGGVGRHARAQLRPHRADHLVVRPVRQFRPGQLRRGQSRHGRADERARRGRPQEQHPRQHHFADGGDPDDRGTAAAAGAGPDEARGDHAGGGISAQRGRADPHHHGRRRRLVRA